MKKKFILNLILLVTLNLLVKPFWVFGIERSVQNIVGSGEYGFYFSLFSFSLLFNIVLDLGITNFNNRSLSRNPSLIHKYFSNMVIVRLFLAVTYGIIVFLLAFLAGYEHRQIQLLTVLVVNQFFALFILYLRSNISGLQFYSTDSFLSVLDRSVMIILCSLVIWGKVLNEPFRIEWFAYIQCISYFIVTVILIIVILSKTGRLSLTFNKGTVLKIIKESLPFALLVFLMGVYTRFDAVMIERLLPDGKVQAGIYAQSFRILDAATQFAILFPSLLLPMFSRQLAQHEDVVQLTQLAFSLIFVFSVAFSFTCVAFSKEVIDLLYHEGNDYSSSIFSVLILTFIPISSNFIFGTLLTANGSFKILNYLAVSLTFINIILNIILIPAHKALGAAIACFVTQSIAAIVQIYFCIKVLQIKFKMFDALKYLLFVILSVIVVKIIAFFSISWIWSFCFTAFSIGAMSFLSGLVPVKELLKFVQEKPWDSKT